jgi:hypothetical protein
MDSHTLSHPYAPTVSYECSLPVAIASYATDHLDRFTTRVVETDSPAGVTLEVSRPDDNVVLGLVHIEQFSAHARKPEQQP